MYSRVLVRLAIFTLMSCSEDDDKTADFYAYQSSLIQRSDEELATGGLDAYFENLSFFTVQELADMDRKLSPQHAGFYDGQFHVFGYLDGDTNHEYMIRGNKNFGWELERFRDHFDVTYGEGKYVVVSSILPNSIGFGGPRIHVSNSGNSTDWETYDLPFSTEMVTVTYLQGKFVGAGDLSTILISDDGVTWQDISLPYESNDWESFSEIFTANGRGFLLSRYNIYNSADATNWSLVYEGNSRLEKLAFGNGIYVVTTLDEDADSYGLLVSTDGENWEVPVTTESEAVNFSNICAYSGDIIFTESIFISSSNCFSEDGINWYKDTDDFEYLDFNISISEAAYGNGTLYFMARSSYIVTTVDYIQ